MSNQDRREFLKRSGVAAFALPSLLRSEPVGASVSNVAASASQELASRRPLPGERRFTSQAVERTIGQVKEAISDPELAWLFENCFPNTLDTTVSFQILDGRPDTFVITGDIEAMWLRDSTAQVWPYLPLAGQDEELKQLLAGVINRQTRCILIDPYANAFNEGPTGSQWQDDLTDMKPELHERKWEIDSVCYALRLAYGYWTEGPIPSSSRETSRPCGCGTPLLRSGRTCPWPARTWS